MRILLAPFHERGHITPMLALAQHLAAAGHQLGFTCARPIKEMVAAAGIDAVTYDLASWRSVPRATINQNPRWLNRWYAAQALAAFGEDGLAVAERAVRDFAPDVMVVDPVVYAAVIAAERAGIPWAGVTAHVLPMAPTGWSCTMSEAADSIRPQLLEHLEQAGVKQPRVRFFEVTSPWLNIVFATEAFAPRSLGSNDWSWLVGPVQWMRPRGDEVAFPWEALRPDRPLVYVSFGGGEALAFTEATIMNIAASVSEAEAQLVFVLHDLMDGPLPARLPSHAIAVRYAPQLALLDRAAAVLTHGGYGTVTEALLRGKPMLVMPIGHEQSLQAELLTRAGAGLGVPVDAPPAAIGAALRRLLTEPAFRERAAALAEDYRRHDGAAAAAALVIALGTERAPRMPAPARRDVTA